MGRAILSKSLTQFSVEKRGCVLSLFFDLRPNYGGGDEDNGDLLQRSRDALLCSVPPALQQATPTHASTGDSRASLGQSPVGSLLLSPGPWGPQGFLCVLQRSVSPVLCKLWQLYGGVNGDLLQEGLCHTKVCCTQSLWPVVGHC